MRLASGVSPLGAPPLTRIGKPLLRASRAP